MATTQGAESAPPPAYNPAAHKQPPPQQQVIVVQQPITTQQVPLQVQPQPATTTAPAQTQPVQQVIYVQQQPHQVVVIPSANIANNNINQQMMQNGGNCWRITLIILWSISIAGAIPQFVMGMVFQGDCYEYDDSGFCWIMWALTIPGAIGLIAGPLSIYGLTKYNYNISVMSCIASGTLLLPGFILMTYEWGFFYFLLCYFAPFIWFLLIFSFSITFTKKLKSAQNGSAAGDDCCKCCYDGCCCDGGESVSYAQPGVALQVAASGGTAGGGQTQVVVVQNPNNVGNVAELMKTNGGYCWRITLIVMWSIAIAGALPQFILGLMIVLWSGSAAWMFGMLFPGIIVLIGGPLSITGAAKYNYQFSMAGVVACGALLLCGLLMHTAEYGYIYFMYVYLVPFTYYSCLSGFSITFTKKLGYIQKNGVAEDVNQDCCKSCYDCCNCEQCCAC